MYDLQPGDKIHFTKTGRIYEVINVTISRILVGNGKEKFSIPEAQLRRQVNKKSIELIYENE